MSAMPRLLLAATAASILLGLPACARSRAPQPGDARPAAVAAPPPFVAPPSPSVAASPVPLAPAASPAWSTATSVGRIVAERPATARVFERRDIDYCCGGATSLGAAAKAAGVDPDALLRDLVAVPLAQASGPERSWVAAPLPDLIDHIEATHHVYLREELPRLSEIVAKVREVHVAAHPEMDEIAAVFARLAAALPPHLEHEEKAAFPAVRALAGGDASARDAALRGLDQMKAEHDEAGAALHDLRRLTRGFEVPADACNLYRRMLAGFLELEEDTHRHVHLENNVLFPRASVLAAR